MSPEKTPRQPRKPFQNLAKKERTQEPFKKKYSRSEGRGDKPYKPKEREERPAKPRFKKERPFPAREDSERPAKRVFKKERPYPAREDGERTAKPRFSKDKPYHSREEGFKSSQRYSSSAPGKKYATRSGIPIKAIKGEPEGIRLNKFIANSGVCSRREADELIKAGVVKVNGVVVTALGSKVMQTDKVQYGDQTLNNEKKRYLLLNKQKGYVTTTKDPHAKNTVMELIAGACKERIYPVGRLDRNTTGLLLFTNDGEMAKKLMHPKSRIIKMYHVVLDQPLSKADMVRIAGGMEVEGDRVEVDSIAYVEDAPDRREVGLQIHSGQNRIIRRMFESMGYKVTKLDRVMYAGLTKRNLPRSKWRFLTEKEVISLIMMR
jgi:23S rRNA pseudouridine2605 synthase